MHSSLDQLASDAEGDEIFVHTNIYRHTPTANLFHKAFTQFEGGGFDLCIQLPRIHSLFDQLQSGHQFSRSGNLHCTFALADLQLASAIADVQGQLVGISGPPPCANTAGYFHTAATAISINN